MQHSFRFRIVAHGAVSVDAVGNTSPPHVHRNSLVPKLPNEHSFLTGALRFPSIIPRKFESGWEDQVPFLSSHILRRLPFLHQRAPVLGGVVEEVMVVAPRKTSGVNREILDATIEKFDWNFPLPSGRLNNSHPVKDPIQRAPRFK